MSVPRFGKPFDYPDADVILRSSDQVDFYVYKFHLIKASSFFEEMLNNAPSQPATTKRPCTRILPLPENKAVLNTLLSAVFPVDLAIPQTYEGMMLVFTAARKYKLDSVISTLRIIFAERVHRLIPRDDAFRAFCLARRHGLIHEAVPAAQMAMKTYNDVERLGENLLFATDSHLSELWLFKQQVEQRVESAISAFRASKSAQTAWKTCRDDAWLIEFYKTMRSECFIPAQSLLQSEFELHVGSGDCTPCKVKKAEKVFSFGKALQGVINGAIEHAIDVFRTVCETNDAPPGPALVCGLSEFGPPFDRTDADVIIRSSDSCHFRIRKSVLAASSEFFEDMFSLPPPPLSNNPNDPDYFDGLPVVHVSENKFMLRNLLSIVFRVRPAVKMASYSDVLAVLAAAQKYEMHKATRDIRALAQAGRLPSPASLPVHLVYALACRHRLEAEATSAAARVIQEPLTIPNIGAHLHAFDGASLHALSDFRTRRRDALVAGLLAARKCTAPSAAAFVTPLPGTSPATASLVSNGCRDASPKLSRDGKVVPKWWLLALRHAGAQVPRSAAPFAVDTLELSEVLGAHRDKHVLETRCAYCVRIATTARTNDFRVALEGELKEALEKVKFSLPW
ncbi:hypothetical protein BC834DRAFT_969646 [Gloeopeniophorella convolvens]|nr:hypothetical protein BC834DRAFT_969646 [Gloeopeniophorella convolvens]